MPTFAEFIDDLFGGGQQVTVEAYSGDVTHHDRYAGPVVVSPAWADTAQRMVATAGGEQVISTATVYVPLGTTAPPMSRVMLPSGRRTVVITSTDFHDGGLDLPEHTQLACQ
jgi:hypothetical protein